MTGTIDSTRNGLQPGSRLRRPLRPGRHLVTTDFPGNVHPLRFAAREARRHDTVSAATSSVC